MWCVFCGQEGLEVRQDKKGRPFMQCAKCTTRVFIRHPQHLAMYEASVNALSEATRLKSDRESDKAKWIELGHKAGVKEGRKIEHAEMLEAIRQADTIKRK
jgi:LmbE family N-acetylglucosaminyl deacetylase